jgi:hypothetical protein
MKMRDMSIAYPIPAAQCTGAMRGPAFFACANNYLIDVNSGIIMDVEMSRAIRQAELSAAKTMIRATLDIKPKRLADDTAYDSGANLNWLVNEANIAPHSHCQLGDQKDQEAPARAFKIRARTPALTTFVVGMGGGISLP